MKDLTKYPVVKELGNALLLLKKNPFWLVIASIIDALFFLAWGFFTTPVSDKIIEHSVLLANQLSEILKQQPGRVPTGLLSKLFSTEMWPYTAKLITLILLLFAIIYLLYCIFHGSSWWMATHIAGEKKTYKHYFLGFAKINLLWIACFILYKFLDLIAGLRHVLVQKIVPGTPNIAGNVLFGLILVVGVAAVFSYPFLRAKTLFATPLSTSIPLIVLSASLYFCAQFILNMIGKININAALLFGLLILFPTMNLIRVYITRVLRNVHPHT
ncbi:MAG: hypothetical protein QW165_05130 [Candidatus Woesearchaeota archaeon]